MPKFALPFVLFCLVAASGASALAPSRVVRCATLLDTQELAGDPVLPSAVEDALAPALRELYQISRDFPDFDGVAGRLRAAFGLARRPSRPLFVTGVGQKTFATNLDEQVAFARVRFLRETIGVNPDRRTPMRRITRGENVVAYLEKVRAQTLRNQTEVDRRKAQRFDDLVRGLADDRARVAEARFKLNAEALNDAQAEGTPSAFDRHVSSLLGLFGFTPAALAYKPFDPRAGASFVAPRLGWLVGPNWAYYTIEHLRLTLRAFWKKTVATRELQTASDREWQILNDARQVEDLDALTEIARTRSASLAYLSYVEVLPLDAGPRDPALNGETILEAAAQSRAPGWRARRVRVHHILTFDETRAPQLVTLILELTRWEQLRDDWLTIFDAILDPNT